MSDILSVNQVIKGTAEPSVRGKDDIGASSAASGLLDQDAAGSREASAKSIRKAVDSFNQLVMSKTSVVFAVDQASDKLLVRVTDAETHELIRQIPSEEALRLAEHIDGMMGIIFEKKA